MAAVHLSVAFHLLCATCLLEVSQSVIFLKNQALVVKRHNFYYEDERFAFPVWKVVSQHLEYAEHHQ